MSLTQLENNLMPKSPRLACFIYNLLGRNIFHPTQIFKAFSNFVSVYFKVNISKRIKGVVLWWSSPSPSVREVRVRFPLGATIHLASECTLAWVNPCHVRGIGYHHSDTRVWRDMLDIVCGLVIMLSGSILARA